MRMNKEVREVTENNIFPAEGNENVANQPAENVTTAEDSLVASAAEAEEATLESVAETMADINVASTLKSAKPAKAKKKKDDYRVSNFDIIRNWRHYNTKERKHYNYIFWHRIAGYVWPLFRFDIIFGLSFVILYPILYMISTSLRPQVEMNDPSVMWIPKTIGFDNFV